MHILLSHLKALVFEISNITSEKHFLIAPGQRRIPISILSDEFCEDEAFSYLLLTGKSAVMLLGEFQ